MFIQRMKFWLFSDDICGISVLGICRLQAENSLLLLCQLCCANSHKSYLYTPTALSPSQHTVFHGEASFTPAGISLFGCCCFVCFFCFCFYTNINHCWNETKSSFKHNEKQRAKTRCPRGMKTDKNQQCLMPKLKGNQARRGERLKSTSRHI